MKNCISTLNNEQKKKKKKTNHQHRSFLHSCFEFYNANSHQYLIKYRHEYRHVTHAEEEGFYNVSILREFLFCWELKFAKPYSCTHENMKVFIRKTYTCLRVLPKLMLMDWEQQTIVSMYFCVKNSEEESFFHSWKNHRQCIFNKQIAID